MNKMTIRPLDIEDIPMVVGMLREFAEEMGYPFDEITAHRLLELGISVGWLQSVCEEAGKPIGACCAMIAPHLADSASLMAIEYVWHSLPSLSGSKRARVMVALLNEMERFAKSKNICLVVSTSEQYKNLGKYCERKGYKLNEHVYRKEVQAWA